MRDRGIYVERTILAPIEQLWERTQTPAQHQRWDLRFSTIEYLPRTTQAEPQRFLYTTRLFGPFTIRGTGETSGERMLPTGEASSSLRFGSAQPWSLIRTGSGYWRYVPVPGGVRFLTRYDYEVRFGWFGRTVDRLVLRPAMGWATAWSFDRLRLWIVDGQPPEISLTLAAVQAIARIAVAGVWLWHGLVPKLLFHDAGELRMLAEAGLPAAVLPWFGAAEVVWGLSMLFAWRRRDVFLVNVAVMLAALAGVALRSSEYLTQAFNPVTLNGCVIALSLIGYSVWSHVPLAVRCGRAPAARDRKDAS